jgi:hypothetical protein
MLGIEPRAQLYPVWKTGVLTATLQRMREKIDFFAYSYNIIIILIIGCSYWTMLL